MNTLWNRRAILTSDKRQVSELTNDIVFGAEWVHNGLVPVASKALNDYLVRKGSYFKKSSLSLNSFFSVRFDRIFISIII